MADKNKKTWGERAKAALEKLPTVQQSLSDCSKQNSQLTAEKAALNKRNDALLVEKEELLQRIGYLNDQFQQIGDAHKQLVTERDELQKHNRVLADKLNSMATELTEQEGRNEQQALTVLKYKQLSERSIWQRIFG